MHGETFFSSCSWGNKSCSPRCYCIEKLWLFVHVTWRLTRIGPITDSDITMPNIMALLICLQRHWNQLLWQLLCQVIYTHLPLIQQNRCRLELMLNPFAASELANSNSRMSSRGARIIFCRGCNLWLIAPTFLLQCIHIKEKNWCSPNSSVENNLASSLFSCNKIVNAILSEL